MTRSFWVDRDMWSTRYDWNGRACEVAKRGLRDWIDNRNDQAELFEVVRVKDCFGFPDVGGYSWMRGVHDFETLWGFKSPRVFGSCWRRHVA